MVAKANEPKSEAPKTAEKTTVTAREIIHERIFDAPRELVFDAFTDIKHLMHWWGPTGFAITNESMQLRARGVWKFTMHGPDGRDYPNVVTYIEVKRPEKLVWAHGTVEAGTAHFHTTVTLEDIGGKTRLTMRAVFPSEAELKKVIKEYNAVEGGKQTLARLKDYLKDAGANTVVITRLFDAPRAAVWKAWTDPVAFMKWWGPKDFMSPVAKMDLRVGGKYHWCMRAPDGKDYWTTGEFLEISPINRLVYSDNFADEKGNVVSPGAYGMTGKWGKMIVTVTLEDIGKRTKMTVHHTGLPAGEMSDMTSGGWNESFDKLAASLK